MRFVQQAQCGKNAKLTGLMLLAEIYGQDIVDPILTLGRQGQSLQTESQWCFSETSEPGSICCTNQHGDSLYCVMGTQVNTLEKVEVLLFGRQSVESNLPLRDYLPKKRDEAGQLTILPWGVGKWLGQRGKLISEVLRQEDTPLFVLGDNGNRPQWWKRVPQFTFAQQNNLPVLRGSDPLFISGQLSRVGTYGHLIEQVLDQKYPLQSLCRHILNWPAHILPCGNLQGILSFIRSQIALRGAKRIS
ncbi:hypothetical protein [Desulfogranum japonicum]|uniref:hypothetical protein n=1 Tax=Desulfogranum japonicum TaxID=231447 RepID=UPI000687A882|nr:hypothetical protein [Desulfogranum japonicum]